ncbi:MAG TPA: glycerophosphodiester phosphodiesterase [Gaiellaceae bacterium]
MLVIAHRGASFERPENTFSAFERALELGVEWIELDVHADAGGRLVVTHDRPHGNRSYPTLEEALDLIHGRARAMVELKTPGQYSRHNVVARTVKLLGAEDVLISFQRQALVEARAMRAGLRTVQHVGFGVSIRGARDAWAAGFHDARVTGRGLAAARRLGLVPLVYTVNEQGRMRALDSLGAGGIFTDRPELALRLFPAAARP